MFERMPSHEKTSAKKEVIPEEFSFYVKILDSFLSRSDNPGRHITDAEKNEARKDTEILNRLVAEKAGGEYEGVQYEKSKYRKGAFTFLSTISMLAEDPNFKKLTTEEARTEITTESSELMERIRELRVKDEPITKTEVEQATKLAEKIKEILVKK